MIEQGIYFALGCIVTALLALLFAPVFWRRALRLTRQRLQLQVPLSMQEILAERDQLRASFAVERLQIEQRMERVQATRTKDLIEIGRRTMEAGALADEVSALRRLEQARQKEIDLLMREAVEMGAEKSSLSLALKESEAKIEEWHRKAETARAAQTTSRANSEGNLVDSLRGRLEAAMSQSTRHETASLSLRRDLDDARTLIRQLEAELVEMRRQRDAGGPATNVQDKAPLMLTEGDQELRASIHALGVAVASLARETPRADEPEPKAQPQSEKKAVRPVGAA